MMTMLGRTRANDVADRTGVMIKPLATQVLVLHLETFRTNLFNPDKLGIPAYVASQGFKVHGISVRHPDGRVVFSSDISSLLADLRSEYGKYLERAVVVAHGGALACFILLHRYGQRVTYPSCTMALSRVVNSPAQSTDLPALAGLFGLPTKSRSTFMEGAYYPTQGHLLSIQKSSREDVELIAKLYERLRQNLNRIPIEMEIIAHNIRMFVERPFDLLEGVVSAGLERLEKGVSEALAARGLTFDHIANDKNFVYLLSSALEEVGESVPTKAGKHGPIPAIATNDEAMIGLRSHSSKEVSELATLRSIIGPVPNFKAQLEYFLKAIETCGGKCYFELTYLGTLHGRFAGTGGFNIQNMSDPANCRESLHSDVANCVRWAVRAPKGRVLVAVDACQIEARVLAWVAGQTDLHSAFAEGRDPYSEFASVIFGRRVERPGDDAGPEAELMRQLRNVGKTAILGLGYNMGVGRFIKTLKSTPDGRDLFEKGILSPGKCGELVRTYRGTYSSIKALWGNANEAFVRALRDGKAEFACASLRRDDGRVLMGLPSGREIIYPNARMVPPSGRERQYIDFEGNDQTFTPGGEEIAFGDDQRLYGGKIVEHLVSGIARDILVVAILALEADGWEVITHCHDEIICTVPPTWADVCAQAMINAWRQPPVWAVGLALDAESKIGPSLGELR